MTALAAFSDWYDVPTEAKLRELRAHAESSDKWIEECRANIKEIKGSQKQEELAIARIESDSRTLKMWVPIAVALSAGLVWLIHHA